MVIGVTVERSKPRVTKLIHKLWHHFTPSRHSNGNIGVSVSCAVLSAMSDSFQTHGL